MTTTQSFFCRSLAMICFALSASAAEAQTLKWSLAHRYDRGEERSLAVHPSGLVLEAHKTDVLGGRGLWYRVGSLSETGVTWGQSQSFPREGHWPNVAISKEGYVIFVWSGGDFKSSSDLYYLVGQIDPAGGIDQSITWLTPRGVFLDAGFHSSIAINDNGVILEVHESGSGRTGLFYQVGHLANPADGDYTIAWDSGANGVKYDDGINPHIALNNYNQAVEVHQVTGEHYMHYRRGTVSGGTISFGGSPRYDNNSSEASVALLDNGVVVEVHRQDDSFAAARTGILNPNDPERVEWLDSVEISDDDSDEARYPAVAAAGNYAIGTWKSLAPDEQGPHLFSSVASLVVPEAFPSEWDFPVSVSPRRARRQAKERSKERSAALQQTVHSTMQSPGRASPGGNDDKAKERRTAPQKTVQSKSESPSSANSGRPHEKAKQPRTGRATAP
jgi:hypothetical protein